MNLSTSQYCTLMINFSISHFAKSLLFCLFANENVNLLFEKNLVFKFLFHYG